MISLFWTIFDLDKIFIYEDKEQNTKSKKINIKKKNSYFSKIFIKS